MSGSAVVAHGGAAVPPGSGSAEFREAWTSTILPTLRAFRPELIIVSAGFDAHRRDPLGGMTVTDEGFAMMAGVVSDLARRVAHGRLALVLEGGYDLQALDESVRACLDVARGVTPPEVAAASQAGERAVQRAIMTQRASWAL